MQNRLAEGPPGQSEKSAPGQGKDRNTPLPPETMEGSRVFFPMMKNRRIHPFFPVAAGSARYGMVLLLIFFFFAFAAAGGSGNAAEEGVEKNTAGGAAAGAAAADSSSGALLPRTAGSGDTGTGPEVARTMFSHASDQKPVLLFLLLLFLLLLLGGAFLLYWFWRRGKMWRRYEAERMKVILASVNEAVIAVDLEEKIRIMNSAAGFLTGYTDGNAEGKPLMEIFHVINSVDGLALDSPVRRVLKSGLALDSAKQMELLSADGSRYFISVRAFPLRNAAGRTDGAVLIFRNLAREQEQNQSLENARKLLQFTLNNIPLGAAVKDVEDDYRYLMVNREFGRYFPVPSAQTPEGKSDFDLFPPALARKMRERDLMAVSEPDEPKEYVDDFSEYNSSIRVFQVIRTVHIADDGHRYLLEICRDQTEKADRERAFNEARLESRQIFDSVSLPLLLLDRDGRIVRANPAACSIAGKPESEVLSSACNFCFCSFPARPDCCPADECRRTLSPASAVIRAHGKEYKVTASPFFDASGALSGILESASDITPEVEYQRNLKNAMETSLSAREMSQVFLDGVGRTAGQPAKQLEESVAALRKSGAHLDESLRKNLEKIHNSASQLMGLFKNLEAIARPDRKPGASAPQDHLKMIDVRNFLQSLLEHFKEEITRKHLECLLKVPENLPLLELDADCMKQVLSNLLSNAVKFTEKGGIEIEAAFEREDVNTTVGCLRVVVRDTGVGIPEEKLRNLFKPSSISVQTSSQDKEQKNTGMALLMTKRLLARVNGSIQVKSEVGKGSAFTFTIPVAGCRMPLVTAAPPAQKKEKALFSGTVLIVDDIDMNLRVFGAMLKKLGIQYASALSAEEAISLMRTRRFDIVFTDIWMPGVSGEELAGKIKSLPGSASLPVVAVTADTVNRSEVFDARIFKPLSIAKLKTFFEDFSSSVSSVGGGEEEEKKK